MGFTRDHPPQLEDVVPVRFYKLTTAGRALLDAHPEVVASTRRKVDHRIFSEVIFDGSTPNLCSFLDCSATSSSLCSLSNQVACEVLG